MTECCKELASYKWYYDGCCDDQDDNKFKYCPFCGVKLE